MKRYRRKKGKERKININRKPGYYWIKVRRPNGTENWIIGRWWQSLQFFDTMGTIKDIGSRDRIIEVDENKLVKEESIVRRRRRHKNNENKGETKNDSK
jgi:hypothetical protein